jgi:hypothetical protein
MNAIQRADYAEQLLANEVLKMAWEAIEGEIVNELKDCPIRDKEGQQELVRLLKTVGKLRSVLIGYVETGKLERMREPKVAEKVQTMFRGRV